MTAGNRSLWMKYVNRLVWYAPAVTASTTSTAFCLSSKLFPLRIIRSSAPTKSVKTVSTWSIPASTLMMSELGCAYFFESAEHRNILNVCRRQSSNSQTPTASLTQRQQTSQGKELTSSACRSATPCPLFTAPTALANSSLVCSSSASMSAGPRPSSIRRSAARSGLSRKNSRQKPSVRSSSSSSLKSSPC